MLNGQVAVITGSAKGLGRHIARWYGAEGAKVAISGRDESKLAQTLKELKAAGVDAIAIPCDVRDETQVQRLMDEAANHFGGLDILVNNAAIVPHFRWGLPVWPGVRDMPQADWNNIMSTILGGTFLATKHALPYLERRGGGHVINIYGWGNLRSHVHVIAKEAVGVFTLYAAEEERKRNICIVCVGPNGAFASDDAPDFLKKDLPSAETSKQLFLRAAEAGMDLSGLMLELRDGALSQRDWTAWDRADRLRADADALDV
jgi:NAD(P)-dependent dehydrogenase (short-subunit alcohol dehydrogenase family)